MSDLSGVKSGPASAQLNPWVWPNAPWRCIHIDFSGSLFGEMFLIIIDAHSKWPEVIVMLSTTSQTMIETLLILFSHYGLPEQGVSENGPQFTSEEFSKFMQDNGIKHILCAPYHPTSNGLAERLCKLLKEQ